MNKVAIYKEHIMEKAAMARAWKTNIGKLTEEGINKLKQNGILNHEKELAGLEKGTDNIIKHHGAISKHFTPEEFAELQGKEMDHSNFYKKQMDKGYFTKNDLLDAAKDGHKDSDGFASISGQKIKVVSKGHLTDGGLFDQYGGGLPKGDFNRRYGEAIFNRHEADELRFGQNSLKGKKNSIQIGDQRAAMGDVSGHISPKVIGSESANVAIAPPEVKRMATNARGYGGELEPFKEQGLNYGTSGKYNKQLNAKMQRNQIKLNRPGYNDVFNGNLFGER